jgi:membrane-associated phospholipid phosphatase
MAVAMALLGAVALGGIVLAVAPGENALDRWGFSVFPDVLPAPFLRAMSDLGLAPVTFGIALVAASLVWRRDPRRALACPIGPALAIGLAELLKIIVGRRFQGALCWPSGTTAAVAAVAAVVVLVSRRGGRPAAVAIGAAVVIFEVVALVSFRWHYLSDALGGVVLGVGCVLLVDAVLHRGHRDRPRRPAAGDRRVGCRPPL